MNTRNRLARSACTVMALAAAIAVGIGGSAAAQKANYPAGGPKPPHWSDLPDWDGLWERGGDIVWDDRIPFVPGDPQVPPFNDQYMKEYQARRAEMRAIALAGKPRNLKGGDLYASMPAMMIALFPIDVQVNPQEVVIITPNGGAREIYTDGRLHPADPLPSTKGHSIGHWEGKTLVVDTCCIKDTTRLPGGGSHSDAMRITERIWSPDGHSLKDDITVEDPKAFTRPWTTEKTYYRRPDWETVEYDPQENTRDFDKPGAGAADQGFHPPGGDVQAAADAPPPPPPPTPPAPPRKPGPLATTEDLQKATALAVGNLAWETVTVRNVQRDPDKVTWVGATRSVNWRCGAHPDGTQPYCEQ
ncbi:MAG TPA: hypothetical protein VG248_09725 [Caulobacteraceae bacterium]|nr:hypothetical protein [Caulobacteraceae bacterium]